MFPPQRWVAVAMLVASQPAPAAAAQHPGDGEPLLRTALESGLEVIVVENHATPLATALVAVRSGAFTQKPGEEGLAHLYEHVVFRSYGKDATAFAREVARLKGAYNGATSEDVVTYFVTVPSEKTEDAIRLLARLLPRARFDKGDLKEERPVVLDELERAASDPEQALDRSVGNDTAIISGDWRLGKHSYAGRRPLLDHPSGALFFGDVVT